jgi:hypothetical protein
MRYFRVPKCYSEVLGGSLKQQTVATANDRFRMNSLNRCEIREPLKIPIDAIERHCFFGLAGWRKVPAPVAELSRTFPVVIKHDVLPKRLTTFNSDWVAGGFFSCVELN